MSSLFLLLLSTGVTFLRSFEFRLGGSRVYDSKPPVRGVEVSGVVRGSSPAMGFPWSPEKSNINNTLS